MVRGILSSVGILLVAAALFLTSLHWSGRVDVVGFFQPRPPLDAAYQRGFRSDSIARFNRLRLPSALPEVTVDESLQAFLDHWVTTLARPEAVELDEVFDVVQSRFPGAQYLAANLVTSRSREDLLDRLSAWSAVASPDFTSINTTVFRTGSRMGVLAVMSRRIPEFSLEEANRKGGRFHNRCPHCGAIHALELARDSQTLILSCPHCELPFDVLAVDDRGRIQRAKDFFDGFYLKETTGGDATPEQRILDLWGQVADRCDYELDQDRLGEKEGGREVWKTASQTWAEASGDCEDTSILLASVLIQAGFEARVAIGWNGNMGQHAWVVVRSGEKQYLLESTIEREIGASDLLEVSEASAYYQPEQLFDSEQIYYTTARPEAFSNDYFSSGIWRTIPEAPENQLSVR